MNLRFVDWIWHVRGSVALAPGQSTDEVFDRLDPLFRQTGTSHRRIGDTLTFSKKDQAAQDKMSIFDGGDLRIVDGAAGSVLRYHLISRALLFCFLAPLMFLGMARSTIFISDLTKPSHEAVKKHTAPAMNPIDKALGAPAPDTKDKDKSNDKMKPTSAYVFASIFAVLYVIGRIGEDRIVRTLFEKRLSGEAPTGATQPRVRTGSRA